MKNKDLIKHLLLLDPELRVICLYDCDCAYTDIQEVLQRQVDGEPQIVLRGS